MGPMLYEHQEEALGKMKNGCILCGGTGSGKSRTALAYFFTRECGGEIPLQNGGELKLPTTPKDLYIITTARKRDSGDWEKECIPFPMESIAVTVDSWNNVTKYQKVQNAFFIFDEQRVVGYGVWSRSFIKISKSNRWILLSATPGDVWLDYVPVFIANGFYKNKTEFEVRHVVYNPYVKYKKVKRYLDVETLKEHKKDILVDMPFERDTEQHHEVIPVGYDRELYLMAARQRWDVYKEEPVQNAGAMCGVLRKIVGSDPKRVSACENLLLDHPKAIVFYNYDYELELLRGLCEKIDRPFGEWNGHNHQDIPYTEEWVYLVQYMAGSEAWNCTETDTIIFYSDNYSYKIMVQASGRIDRLNTEFKDLYLYHLRSDAPIDKAVANALARKKDFNEKDFVGS